jgi:hypothetical protein
VEVQRNRGRIVLPADVRLQVGVEVLLVVAEIVNYVPHGRERHGTLCRRETVCRRRQGRGLRAEPHEAVELLAESKSVGVDIVGDRVHVHLLRRQGRLA